MDEAPSSGASEREPPSWPEETVPILRTTDATAAIAWYERLGFEEEWTHRFAPGMPAFVCVRRGSPGNGVRIFLSEHTGDAQPNGLVYLRVTEIAPVAAAFDAEVHDAGARHEVSLVDPDGNRVRVGAPSGEVDPGLTFPEAAR